MTAAAAAETWAPAFPALLPPLAREGHSTFTFAPDGPPPVRVFAYVPPALSRRTRLLVVMHGRLRNAGDYLGAWAAWAARSDHVVLAPCFDRHGWPGVRGYNLGNVLSRRNGRSAVVPSGRWAFTVVETLVAHVRLQLELADDRFALWGHSAGGQFVHRFLLFRPRAKIRLAVAAGCGWYTAPDPAATFPYGTAHAALPIGDLRAYVAQPLVLMRGGDDTARDTGLRVTRRADAQGPNRHARAAFMLAAAKRLDAGTRWRLVDVPGVGHDAARMAAAAQALWTSL